MTGESITAGETAHTVAQDFKSIIIRNVLEGKEMENTAYTDEETLSNARLIASAPDIAEALKTIPDPSKKFDMGELSKWNKDPRQLSIKDVSRLICYLNDSWYANLQARAALTKAGIE